MILYRGEKTKLTPARIRALRYALLENTTEFGERFARSRRTVEDWEQGRRSPDPMVLRLMLALARDTANAVTPQSPAA